MYLPSLEKINPLNKILPFASFETVLTALPSESNRVNVNSPFFKSRPLKFFLSENSALVAFGVNKLWNTLLSG